ncbi:MAG TPA: hypothetical protein VKY19_22725 [Ktedonosporobacter sp.]|jgi:hypothetical protein|nr:hypothetical protein [Ktedonosporobacter sp.]
MFPTVVNPAPRRHFFRGCLTTLVILLVLAVAGWFLLLRPYLHDIAQTQLDHALSSAIDQMPPQVALLPPGPLQVQENSINNLIVLNLAPSNPVQKPNTTINANGVRVAFELFGLPCAISGMPTVTNGRLVASHVTVEGIIGLIMSPEEMTALLNKHLADAQNRLKHQILNVRLNDHEMDLVLGSPVTS